MTIELNNSCKSEDGLKVHTKLDCVILAAGAGTRFGGNKLIAEFHGQPLIKAVIDTAQSLTPERIIVVSGAGHEQLQTAKIFVAPSSSLSISNTVPELHYCAIWQMGMGHSLAFGVSLLHSHNPVLILLGDQPRIGVQEITRLWSLWRDNPSRIVCARFADTLGVPAIFPLEFRTLLTQCSGDRGAKSLLLSHAQQVLTLDMPAAEFDVDTQEDLQRALIA